MPCSVVFFGRTRRDAAARGARCGLRALHVTGAAHGRGASHRAAGRASWRGSVRGINAYATCYVAMYNKKKNL
eukprot:scaffold10600_cov107-Isochrysis_galbana.AAC.1